MSRTISHGPNNRNGNVSTPVKWPVETIRAPHPELLPRQNAEPDDSQALRAIYANGVLIGSICPSGESWLARDRRGRLIGLFSSHRDAIHALTATVGRA
jgi:hypothetical protein